MRKLLICFAIALAMGAGAVKAAMPEVRIAVLKFGTVNWVMDTIKRQGYDTAAGYRLVVRGYAGKAATTIAFEAGEVDLLVSDWFWGLRQRGKGRPAEPTQKRVEGRAPAAPALVVADPAEQAPRAGRQAERRGC